MARWVIVRSEKGGPEAVSLFYDNLLTGMRYPLGKLGSDVPDNMILDWIFKHGGPAYGDQIRLSDGTRFIFAAPAAGASA
jgi:hypothetical protein